MYTLYHTYMLCLEVLCVISCICIFAYLIYILCYYTYIHTIILYYAIVLIYYTAIYIPFIYILGVLKLKVDKSKSIPIEQVEEAKEIVKRFNTGMTYISI